MIRDLTECCLLATYLRIKFIAWKSIFCVLRTILSPKTRQCWEGTSGHCLNSRTGFASVLQFRFGQALCGHYEIKGVESSDSLRKHDEPEYAWPCTYGHVIMMAHSWRLRFFCFRTDQFQIWNQTLCVVNDIRILIIAYIHSKDVSEGSKLCQTSSKQAIG